MRKLLFLPILTMFCVSSVGAQIESIAASASVESVISQIRNSASELISEAETSAKVAGFSFATDANILLQNLDVMAEELSGKVFRDLNTSQQSILSNAIKLVSETDRSFEDRLGDVNQIISSLGGELSRIPGIDGRPLLAKYSPSYILNTDAAYDLTLSGSLLSSEKSSLLFGATPCLLVSSVESQARYRCPAEIFTTGENEWVTGELKLIKDTPWYNFWGKGQTYSYKIGVMTIQEKLGEYELKVWEKRSSQKRISRSGSNSHRNNHCRSDKSKAWTYRPAPNCSVDVTSINVKHSKSSNSTYEGVINASGSGFQVRGVIRNRGRCGPFGVGHDARGSLRVDATWIDICPATEEIELPTEDGILSWMEDRSFDFPETTTKYVLKINQADGRVKIVDKTLSDDWFTASYDLNTRLLVFKPKALSEALK